MARMPRPSSTSILDARAFASYISPSSRSMARVGALTTSAAINARVAEIDNDSETLSNAFDAETKRRSALYATMIASGQCTGVKTNPSTGLVDCMTPNDGDYSALAKQFTAWKFDWSAFKSAGVTIGNSDELENFAARLHSLRITFEGTTGKTLAVPETPKPEAPSSIGSAVQWSLIGVGGLALFLLLRER